MALGAHEAASGPVDLRRGSLEVLTLRHDSFSRECFVPGMFAAIKAVMHARGLIVGLDAVLDVPATLRQAQGDADE